MSFTPRFHRKKHTLENLYDVAFKLTDKRAKTPTAFIDLWGPIKARDILKEVKLEDIGTYIIEFPEFKYLNDFQKRALNVLVDAKKGPFDSGEFEQIKGEIIEEELENERKVNEMVEQEEDLKRLNDKADAVKAEIAAKELRDLETRLDNLRKGGKKTRKYKNKTKGKRSKTKGKRSKTKGKTNKTKGKRSKNKK